MSNTCKLGREIGTTYNEAMTVRERGRTRPPGLRNPVRPHAGKEVERETIDDKHSPEHRC